MPLFDFELGDEVTWTSQAGGSSKEKEGVVVYKGPEPSGYLPGWNEEFWLSREEFNSVRDVQGRHRFDNVSTGVIVKVNRTHRVTKDLLVPWYYAPRRKNLMVIRRRSDK